MKRKIGLIVAILCYGIGILLSLYVGGWLMLVKPIQQLITAISVGKCTFGLFLTCGVKIFLSATMAGLIWCVGYIGFNHFKGKEEPDWESLEEEYESKKGHKS